MKNNKVHHVYITSQPNSTKEHSIREAIGYACKHNQKVKLDWGGEMFTIEPITLVEMVKDDDSDLPF